MGLAASIAVITALGSLLVWLMVRVRQSSIVAYLALGVISGPFALRLLPTGEAAQALADIGLVMLLFFVGLEFDVKAILKFVRFAAPATIAHVGLITGTLGGIGALLGFSMIQCTLIGLATALSSTAIVMKSFADRKETDSATAQTSLAVLLGQDLVALLVVALIPFFGKAAPTPGHGHEGPSGPLSIVIMAVGVPLLFYVARKVLPPLFKRLALSRNEEMLTLMSLGVCLVVASVTERLGAGLQLGAFLGGLVFSGTYYQHQIRADLTAIKNLALGFCFVSVGMLVDLGWALDHAGLLAAAVVVVILVKLTIGTLAFRLLRLPWSLAAATALALSQVAEFAFIVAQAAQRAAILTEDQFQLVVAVAVLSMLAAPAMVARSGPFGDWVAARFERGKRSGRTIVPPLPHETCRAVVVGYGPVGRTLCKILIRFGVQTCVVDLDLKTVHRLTAMGREAVFGDATRREVLEAAGLHAAQYLLVTTPDFATRARIITSARAVNPAISAISRARYLEERAGLEETGVSQVAYEEAEVAAELARLLLTELDVRAELLDNEVTKLRSEIAVRTGFTMIMRRPSDAPAGKTELYIRDAAGKKAGEGKPAP
jgi:monovalent cation:H+ antiporter-2, CPA2 family